MCFSTDAAGAFLGRKYNVLYFNGDLGFFWLPITVCLIFWIKRTYGIEEVLIVQCCRSNRSKAFEMHLICLICFVWASVIAMFEQCVYADRHEEVIIRANDNII